MYNHQQRYERTSGAAWNAGRSIGPKRALKPQQVWEIRFRLEHEKRIRDRAMFDIAIDSKLRGCDVVKVRIGDVVVGGQIRQRSMVIQQKTGTPVSFEIGETARESFRLWLVVRGTSRPEDFLFPSRLDRSDHVSTRQYARLVHEWGCGDRTGSGAVRYPLATQDQGFFDLQADWEPAGRSDPARASED